jgi:hypothetical protein
MNKEELISEFKILLRQSGTLSDMEFRLSLEQLIRNGGDLGVEVLESLLGSVGLETNLRLQLIRVSGYINQPQLLIPLKKIIELDENIHLKKEAVISVAKFNNQKALNILNHAITSIKNPLLLQTVNNEISKIKQNNPILALLPRFLLGNKNPKNFSVTLNILKRILTPNEASTFLTYLNCGRVDLENGSYEILCASGSADHAHFICDFIIKKWIKAECIEDVECEALNFLLYHANVFLLRYPEKIGQFTEVLHQMVQRARDERVHRLAIGILGKGAAEEDLIFLAEYFEGHPSYQPLVIESLSGNLSATRFLFDLYRQDNPNREAIIATLLQCPEGMDFFFSAFDELAFTDQEFIINHLPQKKSKEINLFIHHVFQNGAFRLKEILMQRVRHNFDPSVAAILFDAEREKEFTFMGEVYLETIRTLFPIQTIRRTIHNLYAEEYSISQIRRILKGLAPLQNLDLFVDFDPPSLLGALMNKILNMNSHELSMQFLLLFRSFRSFDLATVQGCLDALNRIYAQKDSKSTPQEKSELHRCREWWKDNFLDLRDIEEGKTKIMRVMAQDPFSPIAFGELWKSAHISAVMNLEELFDRLRPLFSEKGSSAIVEWTQLFVGLPALGIYMREDIGKLLENQPGLGFAELKRLHDSLPTSPPVVNVLTQSPSHRAIIMESLMYAMPLMTISSDDIELKDHDILLCDTESLKERMLLNRTIPTRLYLFLGKPADLLPYKDLNPRSLIAPYSYYRITREILSRILI